MRSSQDDPAEELEPLFDYSRVQPQDSFRFADDEDSDCEDRRRKRKRNNGGDFTGVKGGKVFIDLDSDGDDGGKLKDGDGEDDEDWLAPPPPKIPNTVSRLLEDKTLQELRLKKEELALVAQSAEKLLKEVSTKKEFNVSARSLMDAEVDKPQKQVERRKVVICIQDKDGQRQFRLYRDDNFERLFKMYADKVKVSLDRLVFSFDGDKVGPSATPDSLGMEDDDMLEAHVK